MIALAFALQVVSAPAASIDQAARDNAAAAQAVAQSAQATAAAAQSAVPSACPSVPMADTLSGTVGSGTPCSTRPDATRPTVIQAKTTVTAADATYSVTFDVPFAAIPVWADARVFGSSQPYLCTVTALTATGASGKCFQIVATTLPVVSTSLLGLVVSPFANAAAGLSVRLVARQ